MESNKIKIIITLIIALLLIVTFSIFKLVDSNNNYEKIEYNQIMESSDTTEEIKQIEEKIKIHIYGEVKYNGIIELEENSRIDDAINKAGGVRENADISKVNLAYKLSDGQKIYIPSVNDNSKEEYIINENEEGIIEGQKDENGKINLNKATQTQLETLPGIGPSLAYRIIEYRQIKGKFTSKEEIKNVAGIGESKYKQIENFVEIK